MRAKLAILSALILTAIPARGATYLQNFHKVFDPLATNVASQIKNTSDGGYVIIGNQMATAVAQPGTRPMVIKLKPNLGIQWNMIYYMPGDFTTSGFLGASIASDIFQTPDGGYIVCGKHVEEFVGDVTFLMRLDAAGNVIWYHTYDGIDSLTSVIQLDRADGLDGYMACGATYLSGMSTPTILRVDGGGAVEWVRYVWSTDNLLQHHGVYNQIIRYTNSAHNPLAALVGNTNQYSSGCNAQHSDVLVTLVDTFGNIPFDKVYGQGTLTDGAGDQWSTDETGNSIVRDTVSDELVIVGNSTSYSVSQCGTPSAYDDVLAFKINPAGTVLWCNRYDVLGNGHQDMGAHVVLSQRRGRQVMLSGWSNTNFLSSNITHDVLYMQLTNSTGQVISGEVFGGNNLDESPSLVESPSLNAVLLGNTYSFSSGQNLVYLIERYQNILRRCHDKGAQVDRIPSPLPTDMPFDAYGFVPDVAIPVVGIRPFMSETTICASVEANVYADPVGTVGNPAPWNP